MTKEELKKEASEKYSNHKISDFQGFYTHHYYYLGYVESAEPREKRIVELEKELEKERKINEEIKVRFVKCNTCTEEMKSKCLMFTENLCEGERCEELVDLVALVNQSELQNKCSELEKENAELKEVHESDKRSLRLIAKKGAELELKIKKLTQHLEPQSMSALFEQVEEEVKQEQRIKELEAYNEKLLNGDIEK